MMCGGSLFCVIGNCVPYDTKTLRCTMPPYFLKSLKTLSLSCLHVSGKMLYFLIV